MKITEKIREVEESKEKRLAGRKGVCVLCGERVHTEQDYIEVTEGYCHRGCIFGSEQPVEA